MKLDESPYLNIVSDDRVQQTLRLMGRPPDERLTAAVSREICERQGIKAMVIGSIASLGSQYVVTLTAVNCQTGDSIARAQAEAASKETVLSALGAATTSLRGKLGESLASIERFDMPVQDVTSGYRGFTRALLEAVELSTFRSTGPSILQELMFRARVKGFRMQEVPIEFVDRTRGQSTLTFRILIQSLLFGRGSSEAGSLKSPGCRRPLCIISATRSKNASSALTASARAAWLPSARYCSRAAQMISLRL